MPKTELRNTNQILGSFRTNLRELDGLEPSSVGGATAELPVKTPVVMLLDDESIFLRLMERTAQKKAIRLVTCSDFGTFRLKFETIKPDLVILDYDLDRHLKATDIAHLMGSVPVILTSRKSEWMKHELESVHHSIRDFVHKKYGAEFILQKAFELAKAQLNLENDGDTQINQSDGSLSSG